MSAGVDLASWWGDIFAGIESPQLFDWREPAQWRWGDVSMGYQNIIDKSNPVRRLEVLADAYDHERAAIRAERISIENS